MQYPYYHPPVVTSDTLPIGYMFDGVSVVGFHYFSSSEVIKNDTGLDRPDQDISLQSIFNKDMFFVSPFMRDWIPYHLQGRIPRLGKLAEIRFTVNKALEIFDINEYYSLFNVSYASNGECTYCRTKSLKQLMSLGYDFIYYTGADRRMELPEGILLYPSNSVNTVTVYEDLPESPYPVINF